MDFVSSKADPDLWLKPAIKPNGDKIYEYVIAYVDDIVFQGVDPKGFMDVFGIRFTLKPGSIKEPDTYVGQMLRSSESQMLRILRNYDGPSSLHPTSRKFFPMWKTELDEVGLTLDSNAQTPVAKGYQPELDLSPELGAKQQNYYQGFIGVLRWICELGRIDILMPVSIVLQYLVSARQGHLEQVFHIFAYLKSHKRSTLVFDDTVPTFRAQHYVKCDWSEFYPEASEALPDNA